VYYIPNLIGTSLNLYTYDLVQLMLIEINIESSEIGFDVFHAIKYQYLVRILKNSILFNWISYVVIFIVSSEKNSGNVSPKFTCCTSCSPFISVQINYDFESLLFFSRTWGSDTDSSSGLWSARIETTVVL
jgi:hypothetical protein